MRKQSRGLSLVNYETTSSSTPQFWTGVTEAILPGLTARAAATEKSRCLPKATIDDIKSLGLQRLMVPKSLGGNFGSVESFYQVIKTAATACPSTAWCLAVYNTAAWLVLRMEEKVQQEVFLNSSFPFCTFVGAPMGKATSVPGGYLLTGQWSWASGSDHSDWIGAGAMSEDPVSGSKEARFFVFEASSSTGLDTWHSAGLCGSGSKDFKVDGIFIPEHRSLSFPLLLKAQAGSPGNPNKLPYHLTTLGFAAVCIGACQGALSEIKNLIGTRILMHGEGPQAHKGWAQMTLANSSLGIELANQSLLLQCKRLDNCCYSDEKPLATEELLRLRAEAAYAARLAHQAAQDLFEITAASSYLLQSPTQRFQRDLQVIMHHPNLNLESVAEAYGRHLMNLPYGLIAL